MTAKTSVLGRLERVDLCDLWQTEAGDFTPWLAQPQNLEQLGNDIGMELELEAQERSVGPFRADILCKETAGGHWVLIENQLERTDHTHLGQLLTYASGLKAVTIIWIAEKFTEEHRAALDWLNEITDERFNFFGIEIELWRIGGSPIAPKFNIVCKPNDWSKTVSEAAAQIDEANLSETKLLQRKYWAGLRDFLVARKGILKPQKPLPQHWTNFALGRSYFHLTAGVNTQQNSLKGWLALLGPDAKAHFHLLHRQKAAIESELGFPLEWLELPDAKESRLEIKAERADIADESDHARQYLWLAERMEKLHRAFSARVKALDASEYDNNQS